MADFDKDEYLSDAEAFDKLASQARSGETATNAQDYQSDEAASSASSQASGEKPGADCAAGAASASAQGSGAADSAAADNAAADAGQAAADAAQNAAAANDADASADGDSDHTSAAADATSAESSDAGDSGLTELGKAKKEAADYLEALQRERADFVNYRARMNKEKQLARERGVEDALVALLPALDNLDRIRENNEKSAEMESLLKQFDRAFAKFSIEKFGQKGDAFDPSHHEAVLHHTSPDVSEAQIDAVVEAGYKMGDRILRAAKVVVVSPEEK
ncbi:nucleotide exchange factor GrpE [Aeriscardovia aeriphila]|uniref:Protein GrpE n=1 Tax=Aeriscardovia aeriphila TaxID=218139 RepID=A0A261FCP6_9BIFI|nr:nucleotide exchange factor GrpE [Aeriscardovia aeriphila]NYI26334.1 molecular chaperone GrpE [Aeriscardovia aeriphila]OZG56878.1 nucleotide exchange factor GrpE [Aeriscardovia aeriphila]